MAKTEVMSIKEFMNKGKKVEDLKTKELKVKDILARVNDPKVKRILTATTTTILVIKFGPLAALPALAAQIAPESVPAAALNEAIRTKIVHAFDPLIEVVKALSYPIAAVMITAGCLFIMVGNKEKGMTMIQMAGIGYILVQLAPVFMQILVGIGGVM